MSVFDEIAQESHEDRSKELQSTYSSKPSKMSSSTQRVFTWVFIFIGIVSTSFIAYYYIQSSKNKAIGKILVTTQDTMIFMKLEQLVQIRKKVNDGENMDAIFGAIMADMFMVKESTSVEILDVDSWNSAYQVEVIDGEYAGKTGWIDSSKIE